MKSRIFVFTIIVLSCMFLLSCTDSKPPKTQPEPETTDQSPKVIIHNEPGVPDKPPDLPYPIAYTSERDGNTEIYITRNAGFAGVNISQNESKDYGFKPFRNGGVFVSQRDGDDDIFYVSFDENLVYENLSNSPSVEKQLSVSRDYQQLLFTSNRDGDMDIFHYIGDGFPPENVTRNEADDSFPVWMPNSGSFYFESNRGGDVDIYLQEIGVAKAWNISENPSRDQFPMPSPDARSVAYESDREGNQDIFLYSFDSDTTINVSNDPLDDHTPLFTPNGKYLFWNRVIDEKNQICRYEFETKDLKIFSVEGSDNYLAEISPDSRYVLFVSNRTGDLEIFLMGIDGADVVQVTNHPASDYYPAFLPDESAEFVGSIFSL